MKLRRVFATTAAVLVGAIAGACGGGDEERDEGAATVRGETQWGMELEVTPFVEPGSDPVLERIDSYREGAGYEEVDYVRVVADNSEGDDAEIAPTVRFARDYDALINGDSVEARYVCEAIEFEWPATSDETRKQYDEIWEESCEDGPPARKVRAGQTVTYYLFVPRDFAGRGIEEMKIFGPLNAELQ